MEELERVAEDYERLAEELSRAAQHCHIAATHFRRKNVPGGRAHACAVEGHVLYVEELLENHFRLHRRQPPLTS